MYAVPFLFGAGVLGARLSVAPRQQSICPTLPSTVTQTVTITLTVTITNWLSISSISLLSVSSQLPSCGNSTSTLSASSSAPPYVNSTSTLSQVSGTPLSGSALPTSTPYTFDPLSNQNIAVYFGQTKATNTTSLTRLCSESSIDIVILAFVISRNYSGPYPQIDFGATCGGLTSLMEQEAPGLLYCPALAADLATCQKSYGKKVLLSIGGEDSDIQFEQASDASSFATILWQLFGPPGNIDMNLRPFGDVIVDGFDIDNENNDDNNYEVLASTFRSLFSSNSLEFYLSSAPRCIFPDASNPLGMLVLCDFVWVQFYNTPACDIGSSGFNQTFKTWSYQLGSGKTKLYLGAPAWPGAVSQGDSYQAIGSGPGMKGLSQKLTAMNLCNFGGLMFWDGAEGILNQDEGRDIISWGKAGLMESASDVR